MKDKIYIPVLVILLIVAIVFIYSTISKSQELQSTRESLATTQEQLAATQNQLSDTRNKLTSTEKGLTDTQEELSNTQSQLSDTQKTLETSNNDLKVTKNLLEQANSDLDLKTTQLDTAQKQSDYLQKTQSALQGQYDSLNVNYQRMTTGYGYLLKDTTYQNVKNFIATDQTDQKTYFDNSFVCGDFASEVMNNATKQGIRCGFVWIYYPGSDGHAIVAFNTSDKGVIYIEPQSDEEVNLKVGVRYYQSIIPKPGYYYPVPTYDDTVDRFVVIW